MVSARTGGLAVALGIGCAILAAPVASADSTDGGSTESDSSSASSATPSSSSAAKAGRAPAAETKPSTDTGSSQGATRGGKSDEATEKPDKASTSEPEATSESATAEPSSTVEAAPKPDPVPTPKPETEHAQEKKDDAPAAPVDSLALSTLASAARRDVADAPAPAAPSAAAPPVVAIDQVPPFGFLQQIPIVGPAVVTPVVALIHQVPIVGDILHTFVGYPVQWGLPPGAPQSRDVKVVSFDGTQIYVHFMPASGLLQGQQAPTVLNGPGLGVTGATNLDGTFLDPILADTLGMLSPGTLRRAGYNVVTWDPRGEYNSGGTLEVNAAEFEGRDMTAIINWVATQPEVKLDGPGDPRLGMIGVSYGGGIQLVTAANDTRVDAIVPAISYNRLDTSLYKNEAFKSSWGTALTAVLTALGGRINPRILPAAVYGDLTGDLLPDDLALFVSRNPDIDGITVPTLLIQGTVDTLFSLAEADATARTLLTNGVTTKVIWFCGGHGVCANNLVDLSDGVLIQRSTLAWLDRYVKEDPLAVTGPQFEWVDQRGQWFSSAKYPVTAGSPIVATSVGESALPLIPYLGGSGFPFVPYAVGAINAVNLRVPEATATTYLVGAPKLSFDYSGTGSAQHLYAQLVENTTGMVLGSIVTPVPVTLDGQTRTATVDLEPMSHTLRAGESLTLQIVSSAGLYETIVPSLGTVSVTDIRVSLPTADPADVTPFSVV